MRVCLIAVEIFAWGKYGGFGRDTRVIGKELVKRGVEVSAVVPRRGDQKPVEELDGIKVYSYQPKDLISSKEIYRRIDADIFHSMEPSFSTYLALKSKPERKHMVTFLDPRNVNDWITELRLPTVNPMQVFLNWLYEDNPLVSTAVRRLDARYAAAHFIAPKAKSKYGLNQTPGFLPTPVEVPDEIKKDKVPTVCFISRWDRRKRPEVFFELVKAFPRVKFLAAGQSRDSDWDKYLREKYGDLPNLEMLGFINQFEGKKLWEILSRSWVMVNTAAREGLPNALKEAAASGCSILSAVDPDQFASRFGYLADRNDFEQGLDELLKDDNWKTRGLKARQYVNEEYELKKSIDKHILIYQKLLE
jgi:glycosyltransferase involved in cell wall biosynthesis